MTRRSQNQNRCRAGKHKRKVVRSRTIVKETVEVDSLTGKKIRRIVVRKTIEIKKTVAGNPSSQPAKAATIFTPVSSEYELHGSTTQLPQRWKLSISQVQQSGSGAIELDGDYILDLVLDDQKTSRWEHTFESRGGLFRASVEARQRRRGGYRLTACLSGISSGPRWSGKVKTIESARLQLEGIPKAYAKFQWPEQIDLVPLKLFGSRFADEEESSRGLFPGSTETHELS